MPLTESQYLEMEGNINAVWDGFFKHKKNYIPELFHVVKKKNAQFTDLTMGTAGRMTKWDGSVAYDNISKGYEKQYRPVKYSTGIQIDRDMWEDKEYERIASRVREIAYGVHKTYVHESADIFNKIVSSADYKTADGQAVASASHKITPDADTQSNLGTNELTYEGLENSMLAMENFTDDRGDKMLIYGDFVLAGPQQRDNCKKLFGSDKEAFVGDNTKNIYKDFSFMIHPMITGKKWFLISKDLMKNGSGLIFFDRRNGRLLERDGNAAKGDFNTEKLSWKSIARYDLGATNWIWVYANNI